MFLQRMRSWVRKKDASFFFYFGARLLSGVLGIVTIRYVVAFLSRAQYGEWGFLGVVGAALVPIVSLSLPQAMMRMYFDHSEDAGVAQRDLVSSVGLANAVGVLLLAGGALLLWALGLQPVLVALYLSLVVTARIAVAFFGYVTLARNDYGLFFFSKTFEAAGYLGFVAWAALSAPAPVEERLFRLSLYLSATLWIVAVVNATYYARRGLLSARARVYGWPEYKRLLDYSLPLVPTFFLGWVLSSSDVWVLRRLSTLVETADYVFAVGIVGVVALVQQSALVDWPRFYFAKLRDGAADRDAAVARRVQLFLLLHLATIVVLRLIARFAYELLGADEYKAGLDYLGYLMLGNYFFLLGNLFSAGLGYAKQTRLVMITFLIPALVNFSLNLWLVPIWGGRAAAASTLTAYALFAVITFVTARKYYRFTGLGAVAAISAAAALASLVPY